MTANEIFDTGRPIPRLASIRVTGPCSLEVCWAEGERAGVTDLVDLAPVVGSYRVYKALRDDAERLPVPRRREMRKRAAVNGSAGFSRSWPTRLLAKPRG